MNMLPPSVGVTAAERTALILTEASYLNIGICCRALYALL